MQRVCDPLGADDSLSVHVLDLGVWQVAGYDVGCLGAGVVVVVSPAMHHHHSLQLLPCGLW